MRPVAQFIAELKRRRVIRALVIWGVAAFAILQVTEPLMRGLHLPEWTLSFVVVLLGVGFPVVAALAWMFDLTPEGLARTDAPAATDPATAARPVAGRLQLALLLGGLGVVAAAPGLVYFFVWQGPARRAAETPSAVAAPAPPAPPALPGAADPATDADAKPSIAVLPFVNMSSDREQEYFSDGITEEILNALAQVEGLRVIGRTSSFAMKGKNEDLRTVAQRLDAANVLEGSVRKAGNRVRITAQLIEASRGSHLWSQAFDRELTDVFAVQEEIARAVVAALRVKLLPGAGQPARAVDTAAHDAFLRGLALFDRGSLESMRQATEQFELAVTRDPSYASAWAWLGRAGFQSADQGMGDTRAAAEKALAAVERAVALAPDSAEGYLARSQVRQGVLDWAGAREDADRARLLLPGSAGVLSRSGSVLLALGRVQEATALFEQVMNLDPLAGNAQISLAILHLATRRYREAEAAARHALDLVPENGRAARTLGLALLLQGRLPEAKEAFHRSTNPFYVDMGDAMVEHALGNERESRRALDAILARPDVRGGSYQMAQIHAWRGEVERAFEWLERGVEARDSGLQYVKTDPLLDRLRGDPRFAKLLARLKLPVG